MPASKPSMKMPELLVFVRLLATGFLGAEVLRAAFYLGENFDPIWSDAPLWAKIGVTLFGALLCLTYAFKRGAFDAAVRVGRSFRLDLLVAIGIGIWINELASASHWLARAHAALQNADPNWAPALFFLLCSVLLSPIIRHWSSSKISTTQLHFIADEEIRDANEDLLASNVQAESFAQTVLASCAQSGLIFGVDGPWGVGKTSFINLAERYWADEKNRIIVCRFEPLRYASEPDLADRLIRDLSAAIQRKVYAPEFRPAASRYSRLIKGKADVSFLGFKLSLEPSQETVDELLDDIDEVLRRIRHRVIIVIDDLDRLDAKTTNSVLFATRRTLKLSQATYVLCYDTEMLAGSNDEGSKAREFLEKFITAKLSLFVDSSNIRDFLRKDWHRAENLQGSIPSDTMLALGSVLNELAEILDGELAVNYLPLLGDLRKVKRFFNAMLLMKIEKCDLGLTDFNRRDLIHLMLLHLHYPGLFRRIYAEETENRSGTFSLRREYENNAFKFTNSAEFSKLLEEQKGPEKFLLAQLFDLTTLEIDLLGDVDKAALVSRACFNQNSFRNLEGYLKLIVRFATPEPQETYVLYQKSVDRVRSGSPIDSVFAHSDFKGDRWQHAHDQFWKVLVNQSHDFTQTVAEDAINSLVNYLPSYSAIANSDVGLRQRSIYSLMRLLDNAGWGRTLGRRLPNTTENVIEISWRIFGEHSYAGKGLLQRLAGVDRGVVGWNDLMLFRLQCSADRQGQLFNLHSALIVHQDESAATSGLVSKLALAGMRKLSQEVFALFKRTYIEPQRNFYAEVNDAPDADFLGKASSQLSLQASSGVQSEQDADLLAKRISSARSAVKLFVIYQLSNHFPPNGSGVGCGYYDEFGAGDNGGIARLMNEYIFGVCFNPSLHENNEFHFLDYCLSNLSSTLSSDDNEDGYIPTKTELPGGLDSRAMGRYWSHHQKLIRQRVLHANNRHVVTSRYTASYSEDLAKVFAVLDELAELAEQIETVAETA